MRRRLLIVLGVLAALAIPAAIILVPRFMDIDPIDDSDLALPEREIDPAQNPFPGIREFAVGAGLAEQFHRAVRIQDGMERADPAFIETLLNNQAENLKRFETVAGKTDWREDRALRLDTNVDYLTSWLELARFKAEVETVHLAESGQPDRAVGSALSLLGFGQRLQKAGGGLIHQLTAMAIATEGIHAVLRLLERGDLAAGAFDRIAEALAGLSFSAEDFAEVYKVEYQTFAKVIDDLAAGRVEITQLARQIESGREPKNFSFKRNRTRKLMADAYRQFIAEALMFRIDAPLENTATFEKVQASPGTMNVSGNRIGWILFCVTVPVGDEINGRHAVFQAGMNLFRVRIALERFHLATGEWPEKIGELVPEYLAEIPADPMDGKPLRYSKEAGVIYSVGLNFNDDGGSAPASPADLGDSSELVIRFKPADGPIAGQTP